MKAREVAAELMKHPDAEVVVKVVNDWVEVVSVAGTGVHRNAVTFEVVGPATGGVIVVEPDL